MVCCLHRFTTQSNTPFRPLAWCIDGLYNTVVSFIACVNKHDPAAPSSNDLTTVGVLILFSLLAFLLPQV